MDFRARASQLKTRHLSIIVPALLSSFDEAPWFRDLYEFHLDSSFAYSRYRNVQGASVQLKEPSNDYLVAFDVGMSPLSSVDAQIEVQFAQTPRQSLGLRSGAIFGRYLWLDDIAGDPVSLTSGLSLRGVSGGSIRDVSSPFHSYFNLELNSAVGKEWSRGSDWKMRTFGLLGLGTGNQGLPWLRVYGEFAYSWIAHQLSCFTEGYFGFGTHDHVNVNNFHGWGKYRHESIDIGVKYSYTFEIWGTLSIAYDQRIFAKTFPAYWHGVLFSYSLPFSLF